MTRLLYKLSTRAFLFTAVLVAFVPFLDQRVLRMAGDEKVYVTQSVEMSRAGRWFVQTLADEPSYFKGPFHYVFVRLGMLVFGNRLIAGTWMNCALALLAGLAMYHLGRRRWNDKSGLLLGLATALNVGMLSHALISQMEVEVCAFYAFAVAALGLARKKSDFKYDVLFWVAAGMAGWIKSPLHSVLIGTGGLLYWIMTKQLLSRLKRPQAWFAVLIGIVVGLAGYLPAFLLDHDNFMATFLGREQFEKSNNHRTWDYVMRPLLYYGLPWTFVVLAGIIRALRASKLMRQTADLPMVKLGVAMSAPTLLFWCLWTYKGQNYNLPAIPALLLFGWACFNGNIPRWSIRAAGALGTLAFFVALGLVWHFWPLPSWWGRVWLILSFVAMLGFAMTFLVTEDSRAVAAGAVAFCLAFGAFITPLGEREVVDMRRFIKDNPGLTYHYYNLDPSIWSEWALLQLTLHYPIYGLHRNEQLAEAVKPGHAVIVQNTDWLNVVLNYWQKNVGKGPHPVVTPWTRWLT
ncbi:MAG: glycosyltransferase family 39 protein, partial [Deltaproteobacteria bacterium]|nr:glycosyltransferase family 39 protein [Deltaproteobacteria bacterium]